MSLPAPFSVTPVQTWRGSYDANKRVWKYYGGVIFFGVHFDCWGPRRLADQYSQNKAILYYNPIPTPAPERMPGPWYRYSVARFSFKSIADEDDQCLLTYHVAKGPWGRPKAAFYVNGNRVHSEEITGEETIMILIPCPASQTTTRAYMFLEGIGILELKRIDCELR